MAPDEGRGDGSGKEGAVATETGDLGGGLEVAEPLMRLRYGGCEGGVGAGAVTLCTLSLLWGWSCLPLADQ